ncbi:MAG TPA: CapA family protein [Streptosporangiaceae bacterium]|nr:CapA family protein [Streptosporangiaceae bacterium]
MRILWAACGAAALLAVSSCSLGQAPRETAAPAAATAPVAVSPPAVIAVAMAAASAAVAGPDLVTSPAPQSMVTLTAVGDTMLGSTPDLPPSPGTYLSAVKPVLTRGAQVVFGNLEGTLTTATSGKCGNGNEPHPDCFAFRDPPSYARVLKAAGFTVLNDANNHSFDFGAAGQAQTVRSIHAAGLAQTGLPGEITRVRAGHATVAFVAFAPYRYTASLLDLPAARALIKQARRQAQLVVVYMHAGAEGAAASHVTGREETYLGEDRGNPEAFAHMAIDAGASLVIASGPHVLRGMQFYKGHLIAYSLGNFAGYSNFSVHGTMTMSAVLRVTLSSSGRFQRGRLYPVQLSSAGHPAGGGGAVAFVRQLSSADFGRTAARIASSGVITPPR